MSEHIVWGSQWGSPGWAYSHLTGESVTVFGNFDVRRIILPVPRQAE